MRTFGLDFGTTNSVLSWRDENGQPQTLAVCHEDKLFDVYRSALYFEPSEIAGRMQLQSWAGPAALAEYSAFGESGRLLQSLKSHLASPHLQSTNIFGTQFTLAQLVARFLKHLQEAAAAAGIAFGGSLTVGRPVRFVGVDADETLALARLREAFACIGVTDCTFVAEPVAAAYAFALQATAGKNAPSRVLIADLGGGTTDFAIVDIVAFGAQPRLQVAATGGIGVAGDDLDAAVIDHVVAPQLGRDGVLKNGMPIPQWLFAAVRRWHQLSFLKAPKTLALLKQLIAEAVDPAPLRALEALIVDNQGFALAQAVAAVKRELSSHAEADFSFALGGLQLRATITRADFESWIAPALAKMKDALAATLQSVGCKPQQIDYVFMTGGTSFVPAVHEMFAACFPAAEIRRGGELTSVAAGLALIGQ